MIAIIDYNMGNHGSIVNMLRRVGAKAILTRDPKEISSAKALILPGVGHFDEGMINLRRLGLIEPLVERVQIEKIPILGICLGMQLFTNKSEEGTVPGLGWINAETKRFRFEGSIRDLKIPHMGWNLVRPICENKFFPQDQQLRFYHLHSYHVCCSEENTLTKTYYGYEFVSGLIHENIIGVQFHPEKSHRFGMEFFYRFCQNFVPRVKIRG